MLQFWLICSSRSRTVQGDIAGPSGLLRRKYRIRCGPWSGAWPVLVSVCRGFVELVHFGGLPGPDVRSGRQHERGVAALRPLEYLAICLRLQAWDLGLAGGRRRAGGLTWPTDDRSRRVTRRCAVRPSGLGTPGCRCAIAGGGHCVPAAEPGTGGVGLVG